MATECEGTNASEGHLPDFDVGKVGLSDDDTNGEDHGDGEADTGLESVNEAGVDEKDEGLASEG